MINQQNLNYLCGLAKQAGQMIMIVYGKDFESWDKEDASPLTEADLAADKVIRHGLENQFPDVFILSEESRSAGDLTPASFFLVDPLDGTKEFIKRNDEFTVNIAYIENGESVMSVVYAPALDELYYAAQGLGAWKQIGSAEAVEIKTQPYQDGTILKVIGSRSHGGEKLSQWLESLAMPYEFLAAGSSLKFCRVAEGQAHLYPRFGPTSQWDTAAAQCLVECAGGQVVDLNNQALTYGFHRDILNPEFVVLNHSSSYDFFVKN